MKKLLLILLCLPLIFTSCKKEDETPNNTGNNNPVLTWEKSYGGSGYDCGNSVQQTTDGGYIITGYTGSFGNGSTDIWLIKTDSQGDTLWAQTFGGGGDEEGSSVQQTVDGGYIIIGHTRSFGAGNADVYLIKTDISGVLQWLQTFGGNASDHGNSVEQTTDGGYIICGRTESFGNGGKDVYLIKTDGNGVEQWTQTFGGSSDDEGASVQQTTDGGYIICGLTESFGNGYEDIWLIKTDSQGDSLWTKTFGGSDSDEGFSVQQTTDGGYVVTGYTESTANGNRNINLIKTDGSGNLQWEQKFGGNLPTAGVSVRQTTDGGYIVSGDGFAVGTASYDVYLIKTDATGLLQWQQTFGGNNEAFGKSVQQTSDGGYIITGGWSYVPNGQTDLYLIKVD